MANFLKTHRRCFGNGDASLIGGFLFDVGAIPTQGGTRGATPRISTNVGQTALWSGREFNESLRALLVGGQSGAGKIFDEFKKILNSRIFYLASRRPGVKQLKGVVCPDGFGSVERLFVVSFSIVAVSIVIRRVKYAERTSVVFFCRQTSLLSRLD